MMYNPKLFAQRVRALIEEHGYSIMGLSIAMFGCRATLGAIINGAERRGSVPRSDTLCKLADEFGVTTDYLTDWATP